MNRQGKHDLVPALFRGAIGVMVLAATFGLAPRPSEGQEAGWRSLPVERGDWRSVEFLNRHVGWAVGAPGHLPQKTHIYRTADGGQTWERLTLYDAFDAAPKFHLVRFYDAKHGWIYGEGAGLLRTTDGGETWLPVESYPGGGNCMLPLAPDVLYTCAGGGYIQRTLDGGKTWDSFRILGHSNWDMHALAFVPPNALFAVGSYMHGGTGILRSQDGGRNWEPLLGLENGHLLDIAFSGERGVALGGNLAYRSEDGGATWKKHPFFPGRGMRRVRFLSETTVIGLSWNYAPTVVISADGGQTWRPGPAIKPSHRLNDLAVVDPGWWYAPDSYGDTIWHYEDPDYAATIAEGILPLPNAITAPDGTVLPPGTYRVELAHVVHDHALGWELLEPAEGVEIGVPEEELGENQYACDPCEGAWPVEADYELYELEPEQEPDSLFNLAFEPSETGLDLVIEVGVTPPGYIAAALDFLNAPAEAVVDVREATNQEKSGLFGRLKRAAGGDVRGALESAASDPTGAAQRFQGVAESPPAIYRLTLRFPLELFKGSNQ